MTVIFVLVLVFLFPDVYSLALQQNLIYLPLMPISRLLDSRLLSANRANRPD